jgi:HD superfamily phosphodiesterase
MNMDDSNARLKKIADFVRTHQQETYDQRPDHGELDHYLSGAGYRWQHTLRVAQWGKVIAKAEEADMETVLAACLLHDIAWFDMIKDSRDHGRVGAEFIRPFLQKLGYEPKQVDDICYAVAAHVDVDHPDTLEARIVTDADNIDRFGAYRVLQWCIPEIGDYEKLADKLRERIQHLENYLQKDPLLTPTGQKLFAKQLKFQIAFFRKFVEERDSSVLPSL